MGCCSAALTQATEKQKPLDRLRVMEPGGWTRSPGTAVLRRAREVRAISQNLAGVLHEWPTTGEILRDFSLNFTPVLRRSRQAAQEEEAEERRRAAEAKAAAEAEAKAAIEAEALVAREAATAAEKEAAAEAERKRLLSLLDTVQSLHEKVDESATALSGIQTGVAEQDKIQLEQERRVGPAFFRVYVWCLRVVWSQRSRGAQIEREFNILEFVGWQFSELQSRLLESVRLNEQLTQKLNVKEQENRDLRKELDEQKTLAAQQERLGQSEQWAVGCLFALPCLGEARFFCAAVA